MHFTAPKLSQALAFDQCPHASVLQRICRHGPWQIPFAITATSLGVHFMAVSSPMSVATADAARDARVPRREVIHPLWVRITHWINALAVILMIGSGWEIYNASPLFAFAFPRSTTLGGWLAGALLRHFAAMCLLVLNGLPSVALR